LVVDETAWRESGEPTPLVVSELSDESQRRKQLVFIDPGRSQLDALADRRQKRSTGRRGVRDQKSESPLATGTADASSPVWLLAQALNSNPPLDQP
jgi:hypothetical protein